MKGPFARLASTEWRLFLREPFAWFFTLAFPLLLVLILGAAFGSYEATAGVRVIDLLVPGILAAVLAYQALVGIPIVFAEYRELGVLRWLYTTPATLTSVVGAHLAVQTAMFALASAATVGVAAVAFDTRFDGSFGHFMGALAVGAVALFAVGLAIATVVHTARTAQAVAAAAYFPMLFLSGAAVPTEEMPSWVQTGAEVLPLTQVVGQLRVAWTGEATVGGSPAASLVYLAVLAVVCGAYAGRRFRWR